MLSSALVVAGLSYAGTYLYDKQWNEARVRDLTVIRHLFRKSHPDESRFPMPGRFQVDDTGRVTGEGASPRSVLEPLRSHGGKQLLTNAEDIHTWCRAYQEHRLRRANPIERGDASDTRNLVLEELKEWSQRLAGLECDEAAQEEVACRVAFLEAFSVDESVFRSGGSERTMRSTLRECVATLKRLVLPVIRTEIATVSARRHLETLVARCIRMFRHLTLYLFYILRQADLPMEGLLSFHDLTSPRHKYRQAVRTVVGQRILQVLSSIPPSLHHRLQYTRSAHDHLNSNPNPASALLLPSLQPPPPHTGQLVLANSTTPTVPVLMPAVVPATWTTFRDLTAHPPFPKPRDDPSPQDLRSSHRSAHPDGNLPAGVPSHFLESSSNTVLNTFCALHGNLQHLLQVTRLADDAKHLAGAGGDLLVYGLATEQMIKLMRTLQMVNCRIRDNLEVVSAGTEHFFDQLVTAENASRRHTEKAWQANYSKCRGLLDAVYEDLGRQAGQGVCEECADKVLRRAKENPVHRMRQVRSATEHFITDVQRWCGPRGLISQPDGAWQGLDSVVLGSQEALKEAGTPLADRHFPDYDIDGSRTGGGDGVKGQLLQDALRRLLHSASLPPPPSSSTPQTSAWSWASMTSALKDVRWDAATAAACVNAAANSVVSSLQPRAPLPSLPTPLSPYSLQEASLVTQGMDQVLSAAKDTIPAQVASHGREHLLQLALDINEKYAGDLVHVEGLLQRLRDRLSATSLPPHRRDAELVNLVYEVTHRSAEYATRAAMSGSKLHALYRGLCDSLSQSRQSAAASELASLPQQLLSAAMPVSLTLRSAGFYGEELAVVGKLMSYLSLVQSSCEKLFNLIRDVSKELHTLCTPSVVRDTLQSDFWREGAPPHGSGQHWCTSVLSSTLKLIATMHQEHLHHLCEFLREHASASGACSPHRSRSRSIHEQEDDDMVLLSHASPLTPPKPSPPPVPPRPRVGSSPALLPVVRPRLNTDEWRCFPPSSTDSDARPTLPVECMGLDGDGDGVEALQFASSGEESDHDALVLPPAYMPFQRTSSASTDELLR